MAKRKQPIRAEVRAYQVGFGDCFLLSFVYPSGRKHVLIDFGTTGLPRGKQPSVHMPAIAQKIVDEIGSEQLVAVVATHRHADHISGFGTDGRTGGSGLLIKKLKPRRVLQPWTEHPDAPTKGLSAPDAENKKGFLRTLANMDSLAQQAKQLAAAKPGWMSAAAIRELAFLGEDNIANKSAVKNLMDMGSGGGARYLCYGQDAGLGKLLPGVKVHVLGPPDLTQSDAIRSQRSKDQDEFWHLVKGVMPSGLTAAGRAGVDRKVAVPPEARWFRDRLQGMSEKGILEIVRQLDDQMNNTSLILLFEFQGKKLLFPGDAQLENWSHALKEAADSATNRALLAEVDFYKVGHHGSLNATPKKMLWENFRKRGSKQLSTMMSTMANKHGKTASKTEVPRRTLVAALEQESELKNTQRIRAADADVLLTVIEGGS